MSYRKDNKQKLPFGLDYNDLNVVVDQKRFKLPLPINGPLNNSEKEIAKEYMNFMTNVKESSFYSDLKDDDIQGINDGIERYSDKYRKKRKPNRLLADHPFIVEFFPEELYDVMGIDNKKKKLLKLNKIQDNKLGENLEDKLRNIEENDNAVLDENNAEKENGEDEFDDEFEEDEDDDYNAEKYFDDGDDDYGADDDDDEAAF
ncbi:BA75_01281T0 [Komagataella pastoris]|uniref:DNA-directed RNA polymerase III subunit n=1 Tax=Komagataella pastoris TaxID=4922 RepID=A0A1B2JAF8_PICPA|nr:BA75_01281T0 [Komagataella pastoris]